MTDVMKINFKYENGIQIIRKSDKYLYILAEQYISLSYKVYKWMQLEQTLVQAAAVDHSTLMKEGNRRSPQHFPVHFKESRA